LHGFNAVDIGAPVGTPVVASARGEVILSKPLSWNGGYGSYIVIKHSNGTQTLYAHTSKNTVSAGEVVEKGQTIGHVGNSGKSTGYHLHFEVRGAKNPF
jgi:murein DD-endopeptidase MepM/ murein hydrolase activator NlpD